MVIFVIFIAQISIGFSTITFNIPDHLEFEFVYDPSFETFFPDNYDIRLQRLQMPHSIESSTMLDMILDPPAQVTHEETIALYEARKSLESRKKAIREVF